MSANRTRQIGRCRRQVTNLEFGNESLGEDLLDRHLVLGAPRDRNPGVDVVDLGRSERGWKKIEKEPESVHVFERPRTVPKRVTHSSCPHPCQSSQSLQPQSSLPKS